MLIGLTYFSNSKGLFFTFKTVFMYLVFFIVLMFYSSDDSSLYLVKKNVQHFLK